MNCVELGTKCCLKIKTGGKTCFGGIYATKYVTSALIIIFFIFVTNILISYRYSNLR